MQRTTISVLAVLLLAGCAAPANNASDANKTLQPRAASAVSGSTPEADPVQPLQEIRFNDCATMELMFPFPYEEDAVPRPLRPKAFDAAGELMLVKFVFRTCQEVLLDGAPDPNATTSGWILFQVEPWQEQRLDGADSYHYLEVLVAKPSEFLRRTSAKLGGLETQNATIRLSFTDVAGNKGMRGAFEGVVDDFRPEANTTMLSAPNRPNGRTIGLYTGTNETDMRVHAFESGPMIAYERGIGQISPTFLPLPSTLQRTPAFVAAAHEIDYDATWRIAQD